MFVDSSVTVDRVVLGDDVMLMLGEVLLEMPLVSVYSVGVVAVFSSVDFPTKNKSHILVYL